MLHRLWSRSFVGDRETSGQKLCEDGVKGVNHPIGRELQYALARLVGQRTHFGGGTKRSSQLEKHAVYVPDPKYERVSSVVNDFGNATCISGSVCTIASRIAAEQPPSKRDGNTKRSDARSKRWISAR